MDQCSVLEEKRYLNRYRSLTIKRLVGYSCFAHSYKTTNLLYCVRWVSERSCDNTTVPGLGRAKETVERFFGLTASALIPGWNE